MQTAYISRVGLSKGWCIAAIAVVSVLVAGAFAQGGDIPAMIQSGRLDQARTALEEQVKVRPADANAWNLLGVVRIQQGDTAGAETAFRKAVTIAPQSESAWLNLGRLYQRVEGPKSLANGISAYETVLKLNPANAEAHHELAVLMQWKGDFRTSLEHLDRLPAEDQRRLPALLLRCADLAGLGQAEAAMATADTILGTPGLTEADVVSILPVLRAHNVDVAVRLMRGLESHHLATSQTAGQMAALYEEKGDFENARAAYDKAAQASPKSTGPLLDLARVAWKQKDYEGVLSYLAHARDLDPKNAGIHFFFGITCNEMNLPVEAKKSFEKALELSPDNAYYNYALGALLLQWSDKSLAIPYLKKFIAAHPDDPRGHLALATAYFAAYRFDEAKAELANPLGNEQTRDNAEYLFGRIAAQQDDLVTAIQHFRNLVAKQPRWPEAHAELAAALVEQQDTEGAKREAEAALALDPENYLANRTILKLYQLAGDPRVKQQTERIQKLMENRDARLKLMQRTIEVQPW